MKTTLNVFGEVAVDSILVPEMAINLRNNCQSGMWTLGDDPVGNKLCCSILKFSKFFGTLGATTDTLWGQVWMVVEQGSSEEIPSNCVMCTYIKTRSLTSFNNLIVKLQAGGVNPALGIFKPEFIRHSGQKPDASGEVKAITYYSLDWKWVERYETGHSIEKLSVCLDHIDRFVDPQGTAKMRCLDGLAASEVQAIISGERQHLLDGNF